MTTNRAIDIAHYEEIRDLTALEREGVASLNAREREIADELRKHRQKQDALLAEMTGEAGEGYASNEILIHDRKLWRLKDEFRQRDEPEAAAVDEAAADEPEPETDTEDATEEAAS